MKESDLKPGDVTTLGALRPGDVGETLIFPELFIVIDNDIDSVHVRTTIQHYENQKPAMKVRYLGPGRIEPASIVINGEPDRVAELETQVRALREACIRASLTVSVYHEAVKILGEALAATAPKGEPCTT